MEPLVDPPTRSPRQCRPKCEFPHFNTQQQPIILASCALLAQGIDHTEPGVYKATSQETCLPPDLLIPRLAEDFT